MKKILKNGDIIEFTLTTNESNPNRNNTYYHPFSGIVLIKEKKIIIIGRNIKYLGKMVVFDARKLYNKLYTSFHGVGNIFNKKYPIKKIGLKKMSEYYFK